MVSKLSEKLISNTTYLTLDWVAATVFSLAYWVIIGKLLSPEQYGIVATVNGLVPFMTMLSTIGLGSALTKLIPEYVVHNGHKVKPMIKFSFKVVLFINIALFITLTLFSTQLAHVFKISTFALVLSAVGVISMTLFFMSGSVLYGFQNMRKYFTSDLIGQISKVVVTILAIYVGLLFYGPIVGFLVGFIIPFLFRFNIKWFSHDSNGFDKKVLFQYSNSALIFIILTSVFGYYQYFILPVMQDQTTAGLFAVALKITTLITMIPTVLINGLFPILSRLSATNSQKRQGILVASVSRYTLFLILPLAAFSILYAKPLVMVFSKSEYLPAASLFPILVVASAIYGMGNLFTQALYAMKKPQLFRNIAIITLLAFLGTSIPFAYFYSSFGLSVSYLLSACVLFALSVILTYRSIHLNMDFTGLLKILAATIIFSAILIVVEYISAPFIFKTIITVASFPAYVIVLMLLKFYNSQDVKIIRFLGEKIPAMRGILHFLANLISE